MGWVGGVGADEGFDDIFVPQAAALAVFECRLEQGQLRVRAAVANVEKLIRPQYAGGGGDFWLGRTGVDLRLDPGRRSAWPRGVVESAIELEVCLDAAGTQAGQRQTAHEQFACVVEIDFSQHFRRQADGVDFPVALDGGHVLELPIPRLEPAPMLGIKVEGILVGGCRAAAAGAEGQPAINHEVGGEEDAILMLDE